MPRNQQSATHLRATYPIGRTSGCGGSVACGRVDCPWPLRGVIGVDGMVPSGSCHVRVDCCVRVVVHVCPCCSSHCIGDAMERATCAMTRYRSLNPISRASRRNGILRGAIPERPRGHRLPDAQTRTESSAEQAGTLIVPRVRVLLRPPLPLFELVEPSSHRRDWGAIDSQAERRGRGESRRARWGVKRVRA
jgi:hypothetical protein